MFFKEFNDLAGPNGLILIVLVFGAYLYMIDMNTPPLIINQKRIAIYKTMKKVKKSYIFCQINDALNT